MRKPTGGWKIAYADFITSMMILFLMLWIMAEAPQEDLRAIGNYFNKSSLSTKTTSDAILQKEIDNSGKNTFVQDNFIKSFDWSEISLHKLSCEDKNLFSSVLEIIKVSHLREEYPENIHIYWRDGLVIEMLDSSNRAIFKDLTSEINLHAMPIIKKIVKILQHQSHHITIDGHATLKKDTRIDPWLLSFERANQIKKYIEKYLHKSKIIKVNANSDQDLLDAAFRNNPHNMRITITLLNSESLKKQHLCMPRNLY